MLIALSAVVVLGAAVYFRGSSSSAPKTVEPPEVSLTAAVNCSGEEVQVTNNDTAAWRDARVEINSNYAHIVPSIRPQQTVTLPADQLTDSNGKSFDPVSMKCQSASIQAFIREGRGHFQTNSLQ
ncbi:MAG TPA: hypothetical protein VHC72_04475 [Bryobacteraceae bacterium]|nr:hypothetical protein [Bryobacteraceae bacterium]